MFGWTKLPNELFCAVRPSFRVPAGPVICLYTYINRLANKYTFHVHSVSWNLTETRFINALDFGKVYEMTLLYYTAYFQKAIDITLPSRWIPELTVRNGLNSYLIHPPRPAPTPLPSDDHPSLLKIKLKQKI